MKTTLLIMAAGLGSRFGKGIKQLTPVGPGGELIIDYSIHDAIEAGFDRIVFIIRKDIEGAFKDTIGDRIARSADCEVAYAFQELDDLPDGFPVPDGRTKPWGTGQAVLAAKELIREPFCVINADDYYGKEAFVRIHDFLAAHAGDQHRYCMAGFILENTLSEHGSVTRGICEVDEKNHLRTVKETYRIIKTDSGAGLEDGGAVDAGAHVSMNMWGLTPEFLDILEAGFVQFLQRDDVKTAEYLLPVIIDALIQKDAVTVEMLETRDKWFGVTYAEDQQYVRDSFQKLVDAGVYSSPLV
ncbi:MAG: nucleotidyltransferase [Lachnospiraceae bacterium]|nr:nucleotidyltransferase [Lachnospiraceae bacterium]